MNLNQLQTFLTIARLGSFRRAAEQLNATQPAVSARIAGLEQSLGATLFDREGGGASLTAKGTELVPMAERLLASAEEIKLKIGESSAISGVMRLGVSETIVQTWLPKFLRQVRRDYPKLDLDVTVDVSINMRDALVSHSLDLAFLMGPVSEFSVSNLDLCAYPLIWVVSPKMGLNKQRYSTAELANHAILTFARNTRPYEGIAQHFRALPGPAPRIFGSTSLAASKQMAIEGLGVAAVPLAYVKDEISRGILHEVKADWTPPPLQFTASYSSAASSQLAEMIAKIGQQVAQDEDLS